MCQQDIQDRTKRDWDRVSREEYEWLKARDKERIRKVLDFYRKGKIKTSTEYHYAALIMQHGDRPDEFGLAHEFAAEALKMGDTSAAWLYAATLDRWLLATGKPQKYGTQFRRNNTGEWELALPIDESITDGERAKYRVPPLSQALQRFKEKYSVDDGMFRWQPPLTPAVRFQ